jgi:hypothetical protein
MRNLPQDGDTVLIRSGLEHGPWLTCSTGVGVGSKSVPPVAASPTFGAAKTAVVKRAAVYLLGFDIKLDITLLL